jgi:hypothetical protein
MNMEEIKFRKKGKPYSVSELEYLCKFYDHDGPELMSYALERPYKTISITVSRLKKSGKFDYYKNLNRYW